MNQFISEKISHSFTATFAFKINIKRIPSLSLRIIDLSFPTSLLSLFFPPRCDAKMNKPRDASSILSVYVYPKARKKEKKPVKATPRSLSYEKIRFRELANRYFSHNRKLNPTKILCGLSAPHLFLMVSMLFQTPCSLYKHRTVISYNHHFMRLYQGILIGL